MGEYFSGEGLATETRFVAETKKGELCQVGKKPAKLMHVKRDGDSAVAASCVSAGSEIFVGMPPSC